MNVPIQVTLPSAGAEWPTAVPDDVGLSDGAIADACHLAEMQNSSALVVAHTSGLVAESYWQPSEGFDQVVGQPVYLEDGRSIEDVASVQKSIVSLLVGIAVKRGLFVLDDAVSSVVGSGWSRAESSRESAITIRHLLTMTSGLDDQCRLPM